METVLVALDLGNQTSMETVCAVLDFVIRFSESADARDGNFVTGCSQLRFAVTHYKLLRSRL